MKAFFRTLVECGGFCSATSGCYFYHFEPEATLCRLSTGLRITAPNSLPLTVYVDVTFPRKDAFFTVNLSVVVAQGIEVWY